MKNLAILMVFALFACVAYVRVTASNADGGLDALVSHYKCYQARHAKGSPRFQPETVFLTDQFRHNVETSVVKLSAFCSRADQDINYDGSIASLPVDLTCYTVRDAPRQQRFLPTNVLATDKLTAGFQTLTLSKVQNFCAPAFKSPVSNLEGHGFICYQAKTAKGQPRFQQRDISIADQFSSGFKDARAIRPVAFCAQSEKKVEAPNDNIQDADFIAKVLLKGGEPLDLHVSTVHATLQRSDPPVSCKTAYTNSVWYDWEVFGENKSLIIDTAGSSYNTVLAVFEDNDPSADGVDLKEVGCNDDTSCSGMSVAAPAGCPSVPASVVQFEAWSGAHYYILVGSSDGHGGKLKLHVTAKPNANGDCPNTASDAKTITGLDFSDHVSTMNATFTAGGNCPAHDPEISCIAQYGSSVWYRYVPSSHQKVTFDTIGSSYPTIIGLFEGGSELDCNVRSLNHILKAGHTYFIVVGARGVDNNNFRGGKLKFHATLIEKLLFDGQSAGDGEAAAAPPDSMTCYQVRQARHRTETEVVEDQFSARQVPSKGPGFWTLTVSGVDSLCVPSTKDACSSGSEDALEPAAPVIIGC